MNRWQKIKILADELGVKPNARRNWKQRGVAHRWRLALLKLAEQRGISLGERDFERAGQNR